MSIAVNSSEVAIVSGKNERRNQKNVNSTNYQVGDLVQGTVSKVADQISIQFSERTAEVSKSTLPDAREGDILNFRVMGQSEDGSMRLQYIPGKEACQSGQPASFTAVMMGNMSMNQGVDTEQDAGKSVEEDQEDLKKIHNNMTQEDYDELSKEGFSLERYELERFERALERIKGQRAEIEEGQTKKAEQIKKTEEELKKVGLSQIDDPMLKKQIAAMLESMNLPASIQNITAVLGAVKLASQAVGLNDNSMGYLLSNHMEPTPVNIYMANYNAKPFESEDTAAKEAEWSDLEEQAKQLVRKMNQCGTAASLEDAKWLFEHNLDINEENVTTYQQLKEIRDHFSVAGTISAVVEGMSKGVEPIQTILADKNSVMVQRTQDGFAQVSEDAVREVLKQNKPMNLMNLREAEESLRKESASAMGAGKADSSLMDKDNQLAQNNQSQIQRELDLVTARRQLEEIRVKLTYDAGMRLAGKGINLQTEGLESIVTELRNLEQEYYSKLLLEGGAQVSQSSIQQLRNTLDSRSIISQSPSYVLGVRFEERNQMTLNDLTQQGQRLTEQFQQANELYEQLMTAPRSDMGDSISKAFANMDSLLEEMGIRPTMDNKRAVRILSYNQMELSETSIEQMKEYDHQVTRLIQSLKPSTVVALIKNQTNPLDTPITELTKQVQKIQEENGATEEEKYSNYLVKIQKHNTLSEQERDSYIGIYRLLNQVEKSDGKAIGYLVNSGREITLNNLLSAVRTARGHGIDAAIDHTFGTLEQTKTATKSISEQMEAAFTNASPLETAKNSYNTQIANELYEHITPEFLNYVESKDDLMDVSMERLYELYQEYSSVNPQTSPDQYQEMIGQVQEVMNMTDEMEFLKGYNKKLSVQNMKSAHTILKSSNDLFEQVTGYMDETESDQAKSVLESSQSMEEFVKNYEKVVNSMSSQLRERMDYPTLTIEDMLAMNGYLKDTAMLKELSTSQYYQVPLSVNGQTIGVGVSIQSSSIEKGRLSISMNSQTFGSVQADLTLSDQELKGLVVCENKSVTALLRRTIENAGSEFPKEIQKVQVNVCTEHGVQGQYAKASKSQNEASSTTEILFQVAKIIITGIKEIDG